MSSRDDENMREAAMVDFVASKRIKVDAAPFEVLQTEDDAFVTPEQIPSGLPLPRVVSLFQTLNLAYALVVDSGKLVGIITRQDVMKAM